MKNTRPSLPIWLGFGLFLVLSLESSIQVEAQIKISKVETLLDALKYLVKFGYLKDLNEVASLLTPSLSPNALDPKNPATSIMRLAFSKFQQYTKLPVTGQFDGPTKAKMNVPRCGNRDILQVDIPARSDLPLRKKRYVTSGFKWEKRELTYKISDFSKRFSPEVTRREVGRAFEAWENVTNLYFRRLDFTDGSREADINMRFASGAHGDIESFDGRGITLGHAFPPGPGIGGDVHFDDDEDWSSEVYTGTNFFHVVVHELGHALGLRHSDVEEAVMYAFARSYQPDFRLHPDDIDGIINLYGKRNANPTFDATEKSTSNNSTATTTSTTTTVTTTTTTTTRKPETNEKVDLCQDSQLDAITSLADGRLYAFRGAYAYRIDPEGGGIMARYTDKISYIFNGLPANIDAAMTYEGKTYFFKGSQYWRYNNRKIDGDFPKLISTDFPGIPDDLDAAFVWSGDNQMYFFKGDKYWSFNPLEKPPVPTNYPLPISQWYGLPPKDIDGAFKSPNGPTYFFKDQTYWLFDDENFQVAESDPPYPRSTRVMWLGCTPYRPDVNELQKGWIRKALGKLTGAVKDVTNHFGNKIKKVTSWIF